ncbi:hypothetical protein [Burkholderia sp. S171]|uniref:hypothetical protein n=1 Tax=Burkholderia sp. S171 TaxID=1641860 RepID=UPI00131E208A|nr:hypothetical protein [Burkholderia sp. S171]
MANPKGPLLCTSFLLTPELREKARVVTEKSGAPLGAMARIALSEYVDRYLERERMYGEAIRGANHE